MGGRAVDRPNIVVRTATLEEVRSIHVVLIAAALRLTDEFGEGHWSRTSTIKTLRNSVGEGTLYAVCIAERIVGTFRISDRKIVFYRKEWFAEPDASALYLRDMAVAPDHQRRGVGRATMEEIDAIAGRGGLVAVRFDAYEGPAGAGPFYQKCGYKLVHRGLVGDTPLEYYEKVLQ